MHGQVWKEFFFENVNLTLFSKGKFREKNIFFYEEKFCYFEREGFIVLLKEKVSFEQAKFEIGNKSRNVKKGFGKRLFFFFITKCHF